MTRDRPESQGGDASALRGAAKASGESEPIVSLREVSKSFPGVLAVQNVSLDILPGEVHALVS